MLKKDNSYRNTCKIPMCGYHPSLGICMWNTDIRKMKWNTKAQERTLKHVALDLPAISVSGIVRKSTIVCQNAVFNRIVQK
jgi:hypothetical protein